MLGRSLYTCNETTPTIYLINSTEAGNLRPVLSQFLVPGGEILVRDLPSPIKHQDGSMSLENQTVCHNYLLWVSQSDVGITGRNQSPLQFLYWQYLKGSDASLVSEGKT